MRNTTLSAYRSRLQRVLDHIGAHLDEPVSLKVLADISCFSPYHFHRVFTGMMGEPVNVYIRRLKLERAAAQLATGNDQVTQVALDAGYESHEAFSRAFRAAFGLSPSAYRTASAPGGPAAPPGVALGRHGGVGRSWKGTAIMDVRIQHRAPTRVVFVPHVGPYQEVGKAWATLRGVLRPDAALGAPFAIAYDDPEVTDPASVRYDACLPVADDFVPGPGLSVKTVEAGDYAVAVHEGPFHGVGRTYAALCGQWLPRSGYDIADRPSLEVYLTDPNTTAPADLRTEIWLPVRKVA